MKRKSIVVSGAAVLFAISGALLLRGTGTADAHCDTLKGPVVTDAKAALEKGDVTPVLKWVKAEREGEIRAAFKKALAVRSKGPEARQLADDYFFETLVRIHRAGEGAPYTGLKPDGTELEPAVAEADKALESGSVDRLAAFLRDQVDRGIRERFARAAEKKKHASESVQAGREYVEASVEFVHYAERLDTDAGRSTGLHAEPEGIEHVHSHQELKSGD